MRDVRSYYNEGTAAIAMPSTSHLRLVYDCERDADPIARPKSEHPAASIHLLCAAVITVLLVGAIFTMHSNIKHRMVFSTIDTRQTECISVMPGDSLWSIASKCSVPGVSTYDLVDWLRQSNSLESSELNVGQVLVVPV